jgi:hypothetical protein
LELLGDLFWSKRTTKQKLLSGRAVSNMKWPPKQQFYDLFDEKHMKFKISLPSFERCDLGNPAGLTSIERRR